MHCPYCNLEYANDRPCFCHPPEARVEQAKPEELVPVAYPRTAGVDFLRLYRSA